MYKILFEINVIDSLRNQEVDFQIYINDFIERRKLGYGVSEMKYFLMSMFNIVGIYLDFVLKVLQSNYIFND